MARKKPNSEPGPGLWSRIRIPVVLYLVFAVIYGLVMWDRLFTVSSDNHFVYMAESFLHGRLDMVTRPPHLNDWAHYDGRWFVSFPPFPAVLMLPGVAIWGMGFLDRLFAFFFAPLGPALFYVLLDALKRRGRIDRKPWELVTLSGVYGLGTVYFFSAVQGTTWFVAHMVGGALLTLYLLASLDARHPVLGGLCLGCAFATRTPMLFAFPFFVYEAMRTSRPDDAPETPGALGYLQSLDWGRLIKKAALFALPVAIIIVLNMLMNQARFDDPFEFGHRYLEVRWAPRIEKWGLFNYHYLGRNLMVVLSLLPWATPDPPYVQVSTHGLALWFTTPIFLYALWPKRRDGFYNALIWTALLVAVPSLFYQNSGWVQFGYRFSLDFTQVILVMIALGGRRFGRLFFTLAAWCLVVNLFGAITFDRMRQFYPMSSTHTYYQPD